MLERKLKGHSYMQAHIESNYDDTHEVLVSYETDVVHKYVGSSIDVELNFRPLNAVAVYWCRGLYSRTTIKHISLYCRENGISYYDLKLCANTNWYLIVIPDVNPYKSYYYNCRTGEILEILNNQKQSYYKKIRAYMYDND